MISSNSTSLPEVAGNAAMLVSPYDIRNFSNGLSVLLSNDATREKLVSNGQLRANEFSWDTAVRKTVEVYEEVSNRFKKPEEPLVGVNP